MSIIFSEREKVFYLSTSNTSYIIQIFESEHIAHVYWGKKIKKLNMISDGTSFPPSSDASNLETNPDRLPQEYPSYGTGDFRNPAYQVELENGTTITDLRYTSHKIFSGKPKLENLPATYVEKDNEAETLELDMVDSITGLTATLSYTVFENLNAITRSVNFKNQGSEKLKLLRALSMSVDFDNDNYDMLQLSGGWCREKHVIKRALVPGVQLIETRRGASSHQQNPFIALLSKGANEVDGEVYGINLVYSGNFVASAEVDQFRSTRVSIGINPFDFTWLLEPGESFQTPEAVMVYSENGIGEMSRTYHKLYRTRICRGVYRDKLRPVLVNNWEATYFNFDAAKIESIAVAGKELGIELFVLDDGWFGKRNSDNCSLGDWVVDKNKLPNGLENLANKITETGMRFGLWFEPEMVSPDSDLYRKHPDWCVHVPNRKSSQERFQRSQLVLDFSRKDVCDEVIKMVSEILGSAPINYVKWDMNRSLTEIGSASLPANRQ